MIGLSWLGRALGSKHAETQRGTEVKGSRAALGGPMVAFTGAGRAGWGASWGGRDAVTLAREGYSRNAVAYRCVRLIAEAAASVPWLLFEGRRETRAHPILDLVGRPNPRETGTAFMEAAHAHLLVSGNAYIEAVSLEGRPRELYGLRPDRMAVVPGEDGWPAAYDYGVGARKVRLRQDGEGLRPILHLTLFDPADDHYGLSPMAAALSALEIHNAAGAWNKALLDNAARPSGALVYAGPEGTRLTQGQFDRLKEELETNFQGAGNAGRPLLLEGGLDWKALSLSPKDMDFVEARQAAAREIATAFGVPPMILGIPGDATYANYQEANRAFWRQTVVPMATRTGRAMLAWLAPAFEGAEGLTLELDLDRIEALSPEREALWRRVEAASFLTEDEKREAVGYGLKERA